MANLLWHGATDDGNVNTAGNYLGAAAPAGADVVYVDGSKSIVAGLDQTAINLGGWIVNPGYTGDIGSPSGYLQLDLQNADLLYRGQGKAYIDTGDNGLDTPDKVTVNCASPSGTLYLKTEVANPLAVARFFRGKVFLEAGNITLAYMSYVSNLLNDLAFTFNDGTLTALRQIGGAFFQNPRTSSTPGAGTPDTVAHYMHGGTAQIRDGDYQACTQYGGTITYMPDVADGILDSLAVWSGTFDATKDERPKTITVAEQHGSGRIITGEHVTLSAGIDTYGVALGELGLDVRVTVA